jgi:hypothetical protein
MLTWQWRLQQLFGSSISPAAIAAALAAIAVAALPAIAVVALPAIAVAAAAIARALNCCQPSASNDRPNSASSELGRQHRSLKYVVADGRLQLCEDL